MVLDYETLKFAWWLLVGILFVGFAIMDGMDMGVGTLLPFLGKSDNERRVIINTVGPHWDGNQVWFITAGGAIFAAWPAVYATAFSGFYFAMLLVLFALFLRPVGFDYRSKLDSPRWRNTWDWGLLIGSAVPVLVFGVAFGNLLQGVPFNFDNFMRPWYTGGFFELLNPFALLTGVVSLSMTVLHGAVWLAMRTDQPIAGRAARAAQIAGLVFIATFALAGIWLSLGIDGFQIVNEPAHSALPNPLTKEVAIVEGAWLHNYQTYPVMLAAPIVGFTAAFLAIILVRIGRHGPAFVMSSLTQAGAIFTAGVSMFPFIMPSSTHPNFSLTIWDASSSHLTLNVMFIAAVIFVPIIVSYTAWNFYKMWRVITIAEITEQSHSAY
ncbi:cytochrome d ubiquinol oxidase subunit II [Thiosocius teredinicola]|uniref:cytochrome d ubiquinol oxidase subunit II n=1 Tax=Thiosocius teredinicola TaxID=1973002 RepID=UPI000990B1D1